MKKGTPFLASIHVVRLPLVMLHEDGTRNTKRAKIGTPIHRRSNLLPQRSDNMLK